MRTRFPRTACLLVAASLMSSCRSPMADANMTEQMRQLADELNGLRQDIGMTHDQVDSLRLVVARQDTLLRQIAGMAGVPVPSK